MFSDVIALYRALGRPQLTQDYSCSFNGAINTATAELATRCQRMGAAFGTVELEDSDDGTVRAEIQMPTNEQGRVYLSLSDLLRQTPSLAFGKLPAHYYVADIDYCSADEVKPEEIVKVEQLAKFIKLLSKLADDRVEFSGRSNRLLFILPTDATKVRKTALAEIKIEEKALEFELPHLQLLEQLVADENANKLHVEERLLTMRSAIADTLASASTESNDLTFLCENWRIIQQKYRANFQAYIQNFAFDDVRKKIIDSELEYASKLTGAFGDVAGKLLALPASLLAISALDALKEDSTFLLGCAGLFLVTIVLWYVLKNIRYQIDRLQSGFEFVFSPLFDKSKTYPSKLRSVLVERKATLERQARLTKVTFWVFSALAFSPTLGAFWKIWVRYPQLATWLKTLFVHLRNLI
ncbi:hypothetical protein AYM40_16095 [Paraburkholderia phytofirmans OLGA172]|uniref:Uncharacterized protein n=1 Tax=Paraburkholderia phytofirmans OLGA172 TaxID=1417228 RepID=A0A167W2Y3_9BURK|nr:hypothetical protein [Paraburkholderia phytofirmans]ANB73707.1 hypothetical protein AYM40_16095 [Paraburkholderia phytofirmans OLGA172]